MANNDEDYTAQFGTFLTIKRWLRQWHPEEQPRTKCQRQEDSTFLHDNAHCDRRSDHCDDDIQKLTEEEIECIFIELVVNLFNKKV